MVNVAKLVIVGIYLDRDWRVWVYNLRLKDVLNNKTTQLNTTKNLAASLSPLAQSFPPS
jgi:hypothetical protein